MSEAPHAPSPRFWVSSRRGALFAALAACLAFCRCDATPAGRACVAQLDCGAGYICDGPREPCAIAGLFASHARCVKIDDGVSGRPCRGDLDCASAGFACQSGVCARFQCEAAPPMYCPAACAENVPLHDCAGGCDCPACPVIVDGGGGG